MCVLALGLFAGVAAIIKSEKQKTALSDPDPYIHDTFSMWRFIEYYIAIIAASLPCLRPLLKQMLNSSNRGTGEGSGHPVPNKSRFSTRNKPVEDDEVPLDEYGTTGHSVEVSSGMSKRAGDGKDSRYSVRELEPNAILIEERWRFS